MPPVVLANRVTPALLPPHQTLQHDLTITTPLNSLANTSANADPRAPVLLRGLALWAPHFAVFRSISSQERHKFLAILRRHRGFAEQSFSLTPILVQ